MWNNFALGIPKLFVILMLSTICVGRKNVLFLMSDDLRVQLGSYEGPYFASRIHPHMYTPNLDKLAAKSLVLKRAYVQQALCAPSRTSLLSGRRPDTTRLYNLHHEWPNATQNFTSIPQYFKNHGYMTKGIGKIFHGYNDTLAWSEEYFDANKTSWDSSGTSWIAVPDGELNHQPLVDEQIASHAIYTLRNLPTAVKSGDRPFFLAVGFRKPHLPWVFPSSVLGHYPLHSINLPDNPYAPTKMPDLAWANYADLRKYNDIKSLKATGNINTTLPDSKVLELRRAYYSAVTWMDSQVGRVLDELERLKLDDNTIVSFLGDHGWQLGEHGEWCKHTNFDLATHAPMMIRIPGLTDSGMATEKLTEFVDLFPTLAEAAGLPGVHSCPEHSQHVRTCHEGSSLMPLIRNPNAAWKNASFSQYSRPGKKLMKKTNSLVMGYSMTTADYRYTEWVKFQNAPLYKAEWSSLYAAELYDHVTDPDENHNVAYETAYANIRSQLSLQLRKGWRKSLPPNYHNTHMCNDSSNHCNGPYYNIFIFSVHVIPFLVLILFLLSSPGKKLYMYILSFTSCFRNRGI